MSTRYLYWKKSIQNKFVSFEDGGGKNLSMNGNNVLRGSMNRHCCEENAPLESELMRLSRSMALSQISCPKPVWLRSKEFEVQNVKDWQPLMSAFLFSHTAKMMGNSQLLQFCLSTFAFFPEWYLLVKIYMLSVCIGWTVTLFIEKMICYDVVSSFLF